MGCVAIKPLTNCGASEQNKGVFKRNVAGGEGDFKPPPCAFHSRLILPLVQDIEEGIPNTSGKSGRLDLEVILIRNSCDMDACSPAPET